MEQMINGDVLIIPSLIVKKIGKIFYMFALLSIFMDSDAFS